MVEQNENLGESLVAAGLAKRTIAVDDYEDQPPELE